MDITETGIMLINVYAIYRTQRLKAPQTVPNTMDAKTQLDVGIEKLYREIKNIDDYEFEFLSMVQKKKYQWPLTRNENIQATLDQCATCQMKSSEP